MLTKVYSEYNCIYELIYKTNYIISILMLSCYRL